MVSVVYLLESTDNYTYVGATVNLDRRIRQHNKEIKGGAHITNNKVINGEYWNIVCYVSGFPDWKSALQFEWRWKQLSRKISLNIKPVTKRIEALKQLLQLDKATTKAIPYCEWIEKPVVNFIEPQSNELVSFFKDIR
jgi:structure-specific endonuclease subunit SLX1